MPINADFNFNKTDVRCLPKLTQWLADNLPSQSVQVATPSLVRRAGAVLHHHAADVDTSQVNLQYVAF